MQGPEWTSLGRPRSPKQVTFAYYLLRYGVKRPILLLECCIYQRLQSTPSARPVGPSVTANSAIEPTGVMRAILPPPVYSVNQTLPSGPATIAPGRLPVES